LCIFPFALVLMFGRMLANMRHAWVIFGVMMTLMVAMIVWGVYWDTLKPNPGLAGLPVDQHLGTWRARSFRFGVSAGSTFAACTTAITCGSVNCMHDSLNPLAGITPLTGMWLKLRLRRQGRGDDQPVVVLDRRRVHRGLMVGRTRSTSARKSRPGR